MYKSSKHDNLYQRIQIEWTITWKYSLILTLQHTKVSEIFIQCSMSDPRSSRTLCFTVDILSISTHPINCDVPQDCGLITENWVKLSQTLVCRKETINPHFYVNIHSICEFFYSSHRVSKFLTSSKQFKNYSITRIDKKERTRHRI